MGCPKCQSANGNYCYECGNQLRERCIECGRMERIGRPVCVTEIERIAEEKRKCRPKQPKTSHWLLVVWTIIWGCSFFVALSQLFNSRYFEGMPYSPALLMINPRFITFMIGLFAWSWVGAYPSSWYWAKQWKKFRLADAQSEEEFWKQNPELKTKYDDWQEWCKSK